MGDTNSKILNDSQLKEFANRFQMVRMQAGTGLSFCIEHATKNEICVKELVLTNEQDAKEYVEMAETKMKLQHDNLIRYVEHFIYRPYFCSQAEKMYVVAEYPFKSLKEEIDQRKKLCQPFLQPQLWSILYSCTSGLSFLFQSQVQYCGICPSNILIDKNGIIKLNDPWLSASDLSEVFVSRDGYASQYLAPEITLAKISQLGDWEVEKANMYGLGVVMLECLGALEAEGTRQNSRKEAIKKGVRDVEKSAQMTKTFVKMLKNMLRTAPEKRIGYEELLLFIDNEDESCNILMRQGQTMSSFAVSGDLNNTTQYKKIPIVTRRHTRNSQKISQKKKPIGDNISQLKNTHSLPTESGSAFSKQPRILHSQISPKTNHSQHSHSYQNSFTFANNPNSTRKVSPHRSTSPSKPTLTVSPSKAHSNNGSTGVSGPSRTPVIQKSPPSDIHVRLFQNEQDRMPTFQPDPIKPIREVSEKSSKSQKSDNPLETKLANVSCEVKRKYPDGSVYEGEEINGKNHGYGRIVYPNRSQYRGNWSEGFMEGEGSLLDSEGNLVYEGLWEKNKLSGYGRLYNTKPQTLKLPFDYWDLNRVSRFWEYYEGKKLYNSGEFKDDMKHGMGKLVLTNKQFFEGNFVKDVVDGHGSFLTLQNGLISGQWKSGQLLS